MSITIWIFQCDGIWTQFQMLSVETWTPETYKEAGWQTGGGHGSFWGPAPWCRPGESRPLGMDEFFFHLPGNVVQDSAKDEIG